MQRGFSVESYTYDQVLNGSWRASKLGPGPLGSEQESPASQDCLRLWLPANTEMHWSSGTRTLRNNCVQFYWPDRWYMLSAFYNEDRLIHTYANVIRPASIELDHLTYVDLELSVLVKPDMSYEILTQAEFDFIAEQMHYDEDTRISALMALRTLTSSIQLSIGCYAVVPLRLDIANLQVCSW